MEKYIEGLRGWRDALGVTVDYRGSTQYDVEEQITVLEQVIAKRPAGIALSAIDSKALTSTINKAVDAGIPVVLFDADAPDSKAYSFLQPTITMQGLRPRTRWRSFSAGKGNRNCDPARAAEP